MRTRSDVIDTLRQRLISARHFGTHPAGGRLPSARTLATELQADARVVLAAYEALEREGLVERRPPSRGFFAVHVAPPPPDAAADASRAASGGGAMPASRAPAGRDDVDDLLVGVLTQALERDVRLVELAELARRSVETVRIRAACIECNTDQIVWLCRELEEDYGVEAAGVELDEAEAALAEPGDGPPSPKRPVAAPHAPMSKALREADLLVTTPSHAPVVESLAARLGKAFIVVTLRAELLRELERRAAREPVYFLGTDPRFATKVRASFDAAPAGHVRPIIHGVDAIGDIPAGAPTYVMRTVRDRLGGVPPRVHVLSTLRVFSAETRLQLVRFIVRANRRAAVAMAELRAG